MGGRRVIQVYVGIHVHFNQQDYSIYSFITNDLTYDPRYLSLKYPSISWFLLLNIWLRGIFAEIMLR